MGGEFLRGMLTEHRGVRGFFLGMWCRRGLAGSRRLGEGGVEVGGATAAGQRQACECGEVGCVNRRIHCVAAEEGSCGW